MLMVLVATECEHPLYDKKIMYRNSLNYTVNFFKMFLIQICSAKGKVAWNIKRIKGFLIFKMTIFT